MINAADCFERWNPRNETSWAWRVFKKHNNELIRMYITFFNVHQYTYKQLCANGANWEDPIDKHFVFSHEREKKHFLDLKDWSTAFNGLENWINLNALVAILSNFETYISTIIPLALESDVGVLFETSKRIDGIEIIKHGKEKPFNFDEYVIGCTKGTWQSRLNYYERAFSKVPQYLINNISTLEKMRILRNNVAHAFGRDIEESRSKGALTILPIKNLPKVQFLKYKNTVWKSAKSIDEHLQKSHIGEY